MVDRVGQQLGNYRLIKLIGEGGYAEVYLGEHIHLGTQAAVKVLHAKLTHDNAEQFRIEALTIARLEHPNIVRILDYGIEDKAPFLILSYAPNGTLRQRHPKGIPLPLTTIVSYVYQLAAALQYAHDEKLIHRDIKPENMLVGRKNEILLTDFGIAQVTQSSDFRSIDQMAGTIPYMAPEQIQGKPRRASDQYSLGIVVYEWLSGNRPFYGSFTEIATQHILVPPTPLHEKNSTIRPAVEGVVLKALSKEPQKRFTNVYDFAVALEQASQPTQPYAIVYPEMRNIPSPSHQPGVEVNLPNSISQPVAETIQPILTSYSNNAAPPTERTYPPTVPMSLPSIPTPSPAFGQIPSLATLTPQAGVSSSLTSLWTRDFIIVFGLMLALTVVGSAIAFNIPHPYGPGNPAGLDHAVEFGLSVLLLVVSIAATAFVGNGIAVGILSLAALSTLLSGFGFLIQTVRDVNQSLYLVPVDPSLFLTIGLPAASIISLLWLTRPHTLINRIVLLVVFGAAALCAFLQVPNMDTDVSKHIYLPLSLILLIQGVLIAAQTERIRNRR